MMPPPTSHPLRHMVAKNFGLALLVGVSCLVELLLQAADHKLVGSILWRSQAYQYAGFWAGLLHNWQPNYAVQPVVMFMTYPFLHSGLSHLIGNMLTLIWLGQIALIRLGTRFFLLLYLASACGGALAFGLISRSPAPMVGASGAVFGLVGAWTYWDWHSRQRPGQTRWKSNGPTFGILLGLVLFNLANWAILDGVLAWETHLGGFLAGGSFAALWAVYARRLPKIRS